MAVQKVPQRCPSCYGLNSCKAFGLEAIDCDIDDGPHLVIIADYNRDSLELSIVDVSEWGAFPEARTRLDQLGASEPLEGGMMDETAPVSLIHYLAS